MTSPGDAQVDAGTMRGDFAVRLWLFAVCALIFAMVLVGGTTRLTDSGLSITEWQPIVGIIPPLDEADWQAAFDKYRQIPEFRIINPDMTLSGFKSIYWWEWGHRFLGRLIGIAFLMPLLIFWLTGRIGRSLLRRLLAVFILGGLQGALGWYMVMSGLADRVDVSQYRLAAHLGLAVLILAATFWIALDLAPRERPGVPVSSARLASASGLTGLIFLQICLGALVAGLDAGQGYNTWPLMEGAFVPDGLGALDPWYLNLFENALTVQFQHRVVAYLVVLWAVLHALSAGTWVLLLTVLTQLALGIWTLLAQAPLGLSLAHQGLAMIVLLVALHHLHALVAARRRRGTGAWISAQAPAS